MLFLDSPPQITPLSTKFMHESGGVLQLDKYRITYHLSPTTYYLPPTIYNVGNKVPTHCDGYGSMCDDLCDANLTTTDSTFSSSYLHGLHGRVDLFGSTVDLPGQVKQKKFIFTECQFH